VVYSPLLLLRYSAKEQVLSTYELPIEEIVSSGPNRLIVFEGAEERVTQLTVGLLERLDWQSALGT